VHWLVSNQQAKHLEIKPQVDKWTLENGN
jgi:hypothetical protein